MRVAIFTDTFSPHINGVTNTLNKMIEYFEQTSIEYRVFAPEYEGCTQLDKTERFYSIKFFLYPECRMAIPNYYRITNVLRDFKPDVIHLMTEFNLGIIGLNYAKKHRIPCLSSYTTNFPIYMDYYRLSILKPAVWNYMRWFHDQADLTVCPSTEAEKLLNGNGIVRTGLFSRGIDSEQFNPSYRSEEIRVKLGIDKKIALLYVGRVSAEKDIDVLASAYSTIKETYGKRIVLVITGDGPYMENCKDMLPHDTIYTGYQTGRYLAAVYASCDIFIMPSSSETFGNVVLEAMASGIAVVGADAGGVAGIIEHRVNGLKFKSRDADSLAHHMHRLIEDPQLRSHLILQGLEYSQNRSWSKIFTNLCKLYESLALDSAQPKISQSHSV